MHPSPSRSPIAGGALLALSLIVGTLFGAIRHQPSIGLLAGLGVGVMLLILVWAIDRLRG